MRRGTLYPTYLPKTPLFLLQEEILLQTQGFSVVRRL